MCKTARDMTMPVSPGHVLSKAPLRDVIENFNLPTAVPKQALFRKTSASRSSRSTASWLSNPTMSRRFCKVFHTTTVQCRFYFKLWCSLKGVACRCHWVPLPENNLSPGHHREGDEGQSVCSGAKEKPRYETRKFWDCHPFLHMEEEDHEVVHGLKASNV